MGKGDKRTRRGKTFKGSYGNSRPQKAKASPKGRGVATGATAVKKAPAVKKTK